MIVVGGSRPSRKACSVSDRYGDSPMGATSSPKNRSRIVVLATMTASYTSLAIDPRLGVDVAQLVVERPPERVAQLARPVALERDARHHVPAAEPLRVLHRTAGHGLAGQEVDELEHDRRRADIEREPEHGRWTRGVYVVVIPARGGRPGS